MADQRPDVPVTNTSYSDPIYDRLETFSEGLQKRWPLVLVLFIIAVAAGLFVQQWRQHAPEAASAHRFLEALGDAEALQELVDNAEMTTVFRARAAMELVQLELDDDQPEQAISHARAGLELAEGADEPALLNSLGLSLAAAQRAAGRLDDALATLATVERQATDLPMHRLESQVAQAHILDQQASASEEPAQQEDLLNQALAILAPLRNESGIGRGQHIDAARFLYHDIIRRHPQLDPEAEPAAEPQVEDPPMPALEETAPASE